MSGPSQIPEGREIASNVRPEREDRRVTNEGGAVIIPAPRPWDGGFPGLFRLAGFGGAALYMRTQVCPAATGSECSLAFDVSLHSPESESRYFARFAQPGLVEALSAFFLQAAADWHPEASLPAISDPVLGLQIAVTSSTDTRVGLLVTLTEADDPEEPDGLDFETTRATLAQAALDVRDLTSVEAWPGGVATPPEDWV